MAAEADQKTEAPTPRRREEARRDGDVLQSKELGTALILVGGAAWCWFAGPLFVGACRAVLAQGLTVSHADLVAFDPGGAALRLLLPLLIPMAALFAVSLFAAAAGPALLGSLGFRSSGYAFKASRINPAAGIRRVFSLNGIVELAKSIGKTLLVGSVGYWLLATHARTLVSLGVMDTDASLGVAGRFFNFALAVLAGSLLLIALIDVPAQIFQRNRRLRMSKDEVREDLKQTEGSPELKRAIRRRQHEVLSGSARKAVREATVVLTNPTHFAIALRYDPTKDGAPLVVARGRGDTAQAIKELAGDAGVPMLEYPQLTRAIYYTSRAGQLIAEDLYVAVATVLAFVFRLEQSLAEGVEQPSVLVPEGKRFDENGRPLAI